MFVTGVQTCALPICKKEELKSLKAEKEKSDAARIIAAVQESGKSVDEVLTLLSPAETS